MTTIILRCADCGAEFEPDDAAHKEFYMGECWGTPAYEEWTVCPECGSVEIDEEERENEE